MTGTAESETAKTVDKPSADKPSDDDKSIDWKSKSREWEKRAKANADAADRLAQLEESQKTEAQKLADAKTAAEQEAVAARADALRWRIAARHGISDEDAELFLSGTDEATLTKQAERLTQRVADRKKTNNVVPKEGTMSQPPSNDIAEFTRQLFHPE